MKKLITLFFAILPMYAHADDKLINCDVPQGSRIDYFLQNAANLKNETFLLGRDSVSGMHPQIMLKANNRDVLFTIGDANELKANKIKSGNMTVLAYNDEQISFTGLVNGAPILATYYPKMSILIYSQQSTWQNTNFVGARAVMFYSKCQ